MTGRKAKSIIIAIAVIAAFHFAAWFILIRFTGVIEDNPTTMKKYGPEVFSDFSHRWDILMFPTSKSQLYKNEDMTEKLGRALDAPVVVNSEEAKKGCVGKYLPDGAYAFASYDTLILLPAKADKKHLQGRYGEYNSWDWSVKKLDNGNNEATFVLNDNKHARADRYIYEIKGNKIVFLKQGVIPGVEQGVLLLKTLKAMVVTYPISVLFCIMLFFLYRKTKGKHVCIKKIL